MAVMPQSLNGDDRDKISNEIGMEP